ncbi:MAG: ribosomal protein [Acidimicrobiaceae bacterium]|nr:ribosomal protein [Acidimicrobiaceae bacterium]
MPGPEEDAALRPYEIAVIFDASLDETVIRETIDRVVNHVRAEGGTPGHVDRWGRRTFAYELNHRTEGYYVFIEVVAEPEVLAEVDRTLALNDAVLRHRVIRQPEHVAGRKRGPSTPPVADVAPAAQAG